MPNTLGIAVRVAVPIADESVRDQALAHLLDLGAQAARLPADLLKPDAFGAGRYSALVWACRPKLAEVCRRLMAFRDRFPQAPVLL